MSRTYLLLLLYLIILSSCDTRMRPVEELRDITEELKEKSDNYTEEDWVSLAVIGLQLLLNKLSCHSILVVIHPDKFVTIPK